MMIRVLISLLFLSSCAHQKVIFYKDTTQILNPSYKKNQNFFLSGVFQRKQVLPLYICDNVENIYSLEAKTAPENAIVSLITAGLLYPRQSLIYCKTDQL